MAILKKDWKFGGLLLVGLLGFGVTQSVAADPKGIRFVDNNQVLAESKAMADIQQQIEKKRSEFQKEISEKETALRKEHEGLMAQEKKLDAEVFKKKQQDFETKVESIKTLVESRRQKLEAAYAGAMQKLQEEFQAVVQTVMQQNKAEIALQKGAALWVADGKLDLTREVIALLNKKTPKVKVDFSKSISVLPGNVEVPKELR